MYILFIAIALILSFLSNIIINKIETKNNNYEVLKIIMKNFVIFVSVFIGIYIEYSHESLNKNGTKIFISIVICAVCILISLLPIFETYILEQIKILKLKFIKFIDKLKDKLKEQLTGTQLGSAFINALSSTAITILGVYMFKLFVIISNIFPYFSLLLVVGICLFFIMIFIYIHKQKEIVEHTDENEKTDTEHEEQQTN